MKSFLQIVCLAALCCAALCQLDCDPSSSRGCGCFFNGIYYAVGKALDVACVTMVCRRGDEGYEWYTNNQIDGKCDQCKSQNDPHLNTFDWYHDPLGLGHYDWHGICRYSLVEHVEDWSYGLSNPQPPQFAIYVQFDVCPWVAIPPPSCHGITSYQVTQFWDDVVHVDHGNHMRIYNDVGDVTIMAGNPPNPVILGSTNYGLLAWEFEGCLRLVGVHLLCHICPWGVRVWTPRVNLDHLGGLCGKYNHNVNDDQTERDNTEHPWVHKPQAFPVSWRVPPHMQFEEECECPPDVTELVQTPCRKAARFELKCRNYLANCRAPQHIIEDIIRMCVTDLCFNAGNRRAKSTWLDTARVVCDEDARLNGNIIIGNEPPVEVDVVKRN